MKIVWFIRHGESEGNAGLATSNHADILLTERGKAQAGHIASHFPTAPSLVITSPFIRSKQTAEPTLLRFPTSACEEWPVHEFTYLSPPRYANTTKHHRRPMVEQFWQRGDPHYRDGDGAESFADLLERIAYTMQAIEQRHDSFIAIFSHGLFVRTLLWVLLSGNVEASGLTMSRAHAFCDSLMMPNAAILKIKLAEDGELSFSQFITSHLPDHLLSI